MSDLLDEPRAVVREREGGREGGREGERREGGRGREGEEGENIDMERRGRRGREKETEGTPSLHSIVFCCGSFGPHPALGWKDRSSEERES